MNLQDLEKKYFDLVWYARSNRMDDPYWLGKPTEIRNAAFEKQMIVEREYPEEVQKLHKCEDNWEHGFNSGVLAAIRTVLDGSLDDFPNLDT